MPLHHVEFRFLQVITNHLTGDRVTVAVVHWDRSILRVKTSDHAATRSPELKRSLAGLVRSAKKHPPGQADLRSLGDVFPVPTEYGGALSWSEVFEGVTQDPQRHFEATAELARLEQHTASQRIGRRQVHGKLVQLAPLSWRNGRWNHAVAWSFDVPAEKIEDRVKQLVGMIETSIPRGDGAVIAYATATSSAIADAADREIQYLTGTQAMHRAVRLDRAQQQLDTAEFERLVVADLRH